MLNENNKKYDEKENKEPFIPIHLSKYCLYSVQIILFTSFIAFFCNYKVLSLLLLCLYITSSLFWINPIYGIKKYIDQFFVVIVLSYLTYLSFGFKKIYKKIWIITFISVVIIGILNQLIFYYKIARIFTKESYKNEGLINKSEYSYFNLDYTYPNTEEREKTCLYNIIIHCFCIHIVPSVVGSICIIQNSL
jgi:hypothetical protein